MKMEVMCQSGQYPPVLPVQNYQTVVQPTSFTGMMGVQYDGVL